jgi:hypothetical protein
VERHDPHAVAFLGLATAAAVTYYQVMDQPLQAEGLAQLNGLLQDIATALSNVAPIYWTDADSGTCKPLDQVDLLFGVFLRGATVFKTPRAEFRNLSIRRDDMRSAIAIFRGAGLKFQLRRERPQARSAANYDPGSEFPTPR